MRGVVRNMHMQHAADKEKQPHQHLHASYPSSADNTPMISHPGSRAHLEQVLVHGQDVAAGSNGSSLLTAEQHKPAGRLAIAAAGRHIQTGRQAGRQVGHTVMLAQPAVAHM